ncbi:MAG: ATP-binding protein [Actinomycetota bacterium]|nr:ATP-binding protein [Actinomycetota bacterium]
MGPFVGREPELEALTTWAVDARDGRGALVVLSGSPGAGRTRLAAALCERAAAQGLRPVWSHSPPDGGASALAPWAEIVRGAIGDTEVAALTAGLDGVATVQALGLVPDLIPVELAPVGDPPPDRLALFDGTAHLLRHLARVQPLVVVLDDFDAAGIASLRFLEFLLPELAETPMLVVAIWRESVPSSLDGDAHRLVLPPPGAGEVGPHHVGPARDIDPGTAVREAEQAGDSASAELAWEDAAGHYRQALDALTATDGPYADDRRRLLLAAGRALLSAGDAEGGRSAYEEAADLARRRGRPDDLARAALGLSATLDAFDPRPPDPAARPLIEEALADLGSRHPELRARLGARLSMALGTAVPPEPTRRQELSDEAVALARSVGDGPALVAALISRCDAATGPVDRQARLDDADEILRLTGRSGDLERELVGRRLRVIALLEGGDIDAVDAEIAAFAAVTERLGQPRLSWIVALWQAMRALLQGRFAECERRNSEAATLGRRGGAARAMSLTTVQFFGLRVAQDRLVELEAPARALAERPGDRADSGAILACLLGLRGRDGQACAELARLGRDRFGTVGAHDPRWLAAMVVLAELAATLDRRPEATVLYELLLPYARFFAVEAMGSVCHGSVSRHLGLLAHALGRWEEADIHFAHALEDNTSAGAPLLVAHTRSQWSALRRARDIDGDWEQGLELLIGAEAIYRRLGVDRLADEARQVLARSHEPAASERGSAGNAFRREGDRWFLSYGGVQVRVGDSLGMHDLAAFVANPGRSFHVADLAAGGFGGGVGQAGQRPRTVPGTTGDDAPPPKADIEALTRAEYRVRLAELDDLGATADPVRVALARAERDFIEAELADADSAGPTGTDPVERARRAVATRIRLSLDRIDDAHPALGRHLRHSVRTGMFCSYEPEIPTNWASAGFHAGSG